VVNQNPQPSITADGPITFCDGDSVTLNTSATGTYLWPGNITKSTLTVKQAGIYAMLLTDANGCKALSNAISVTVNSLPDATVTPDGPTSFCTGGSVTLSAPAADTYLWNTNETTQSIVVQNQGIFSVEVSNANACKASSTPITVNVNDAPKPTVILAKDLLTSSEVSGNQWKLNGIAIAGATGQIYKASENGIYAVDVNMGGCIGTSEDVIVNTVSVSNPYFNADIEIFPNPSKAYFQIHLNNQKLIEYSIFNALGKLIETNTFEDNTNIDLSSYSSGIYTIHLKSEGSQTVKKLIKN
jgi:hypothetical protein